MNGTTNNKKIYNLYGFVVLVVAVVLTGWLVWSVNDSNQIALAQTCPANGSIPRTGPTNNCDPSCSNAQCQLYPTDVCERPSSVYPYRCCPPELNCPGTICFGGTCGTIFVTVGGGPGSYSVSATGANAGCSGAFPGTTYTSSKIYNCSCPGTYTLNAPGAISGNGQTASFSCSSRGTVNWSVVFPTPIPTPTPTPCSGASCPTPTPPPDIVPPAISNVRITNITVNSATVAWDTNEPSDSQVEYCIGFSRCGTNTPILTQLVSNHTVNLSGLRAGTVYGVWVKSRDGAGNLGTLGYFPFTTLTQATPTPIFSATPTPIPSTSPAPVIISNVNISNITYHSVTVSWDTDRPATSAVIACTNAFYCSSAWAIDATLVTNHSLTLNRLAPDTEYYLWIISRDAARARGYLTTQNFRTLVGLAIANLNATGTQSSITVNWNTNHPSSSLLIACRFSFWCYGAVIVSDLNNVTAHSLTATGLNPGTRYYYYVVSRDTIGYMVYTNNTVVTSP